MSATSRDVRASYEGHHTSGAGAGRFLLDLEVS